MRGNQLKQYNTGSGATTVVHTFGAYTAVSGKGESDICFDGDHFVLVGDNWSVFVFQISTGTSGPALDTGGRGIDSVYITPDDNVTVTWLQAGSSRYNGIELFDRNMRFQRQLSRVGGHMDVTRDLNGEEVLILSNAADPAPKCDNAVVKIRLADGQQTCLLDAGLEPSRSCFRTRQRRVVLRRNVCSRRPDRDTRLDPVHQRGVAGEA